MTAGEIIVAVLCGGAGAGIIKGVYDLILWSKNRKATKEDRQEQSQTERIGTMEKQITALCTAMRYVLYDRIRYLGQAYIANGNVDFDERRILNEMHSAYHNGLGGNGDLDVLMREVNALPLATK